MIKRGDVCNGFGDLARFNGAPQQWGVCGVSAAQAAAAEQFGWHVIGAGHRAVYVMRDLEDRPIKGIDGVHEKQKSMEDIWRAAVARSRLEGAALALVDALRKIRGAISL